MNGTPKLPIKVVPPMQEDFYRPDGGGGDPKVFENPTPEVRAMFANQVIEIRDAYADAFRETPGVPAVARLTLREDAVAKSHRPTKILSQRTCPIIGSEGLGELLLSVTPIGLENLARAIEQDESKSGIANISTFQAFEPYVPSVDIPADLAKPAKVKLFRHHVQASDEALDNAFERMLSRSTSATIKEIVYGPGLKVFRLDTIDPQVLRELTRFIGTQSISTFPLYHPVRTAATAVRNIMPGDFPPPEDGVAYPLVGVVDAGTTPDDPQLAPWIHSRDVYVPQEFQDNTHGNFVAGLVVHGRRLNHGDSLFPDCSSRVVDVVALGTNGTTEDELLSIIEQALIDHPDVKFWNLSLGTENPISDRTFSDFAVALDRLQDEHGVTFILAAGNYQRLPLRTWPPQDLMGADRVCAPADSVRAVVVGSTAHRDHSSSTVKAGEPSPFSRRGPGPLYLPKPELSHIGGNCNVSGNCSQIGVLSLDGRGHVAEDIGTSFATPLVSTLAANLSNRIVGGNSRQLNRALMVHSAALASGKVDHSLLPYRGFGLPPDIDQITGCEPWQCTLIFELELQPSTAYNKAVFPMPTCLYVDEDTVRANILMTLVYEPSLDIRFGSEYCRTNVEISMGTYDVGKDGKRHQNKKVPEDPQLKGSGFEKDLVEHGFKWSPVKVYRREMVRGVRGQLWRLDMSVQHRSGHTPTEPIRVALVVTVSDPERKADVYNDMVVQMNNLGWAANDLQLQPRLRP